jgi:hypothetical protein
MISLRATTNLLIYLSVAFGLLLLAQLYSLVPTWLFYSVLAGWIVYVLAAVAAAIGRKTAYPVAFLLSILTLIVSLPQPEHQSFVKSELSLASLTFLVGSALQIALLILIPILLMKMRTKHQNHVR